MAVAVVFCTTVDCTVYIHQFTAVKHICTQYAVGWNPNLRQTHAIVEGIVADRGAVAIIEVDTEQWKNDGRDSK